MLSNTEAELKKGIAYKKICERLGTNEIIKQNERIKYQVQNNAILLFEVKKNTENINPVVWKTSYIKTILLSKCATCGSKKSRFIKEQKATGLDVKTPLSKILLLCDILIP